MTESTLFDYGILTPENREMVQEHTGEIRRLARRAAEDIVEIGQRLIEVRDTLGYGLFDSWVKTEFGWGRATAYRFIQVAETFSCLNLGQVNIAPSALYLLASGSTPEVIRAEMVEMAQATGQPITHWDVKERLRLHTQPEMVTVLADEEELPDEPPVSMDNVSQAPTPYVPIVDNGPDMAPPRKPKEPYTPLPIELEERTLKDGTVVMVPALPETPKQQELNGRDWEKAAQRFETSAAKLLTLITSLENYTPQQLHDLMNSPEGRASGAAVRVQQIKRRMADLQEAWGALESVKPTVDAATLIEILPPAKQDDDDTLLLN